MKKHGNIQRWNHIKHFVTTHPYSEDNLDYLKNWLEQFTTESMTTKAENLEKCSHWKPEDNNGKQKIPYGNNSIPRSMIVDGAKCKRCEKTLTEEDWDNSLYATHYRLCKKCASKIDI